MLARPPSRSLAQRFPEDEEEGKRLEAGVRQGQGGGAGGMSSAFASLEPVPPPKGRSHRGSDEGSRTYFLSEPALALSSPNSPRYNSHGSRKALHDVGVLHKERFSPGWLTSLYLARAVLNLH